MACYGLLIALKKNGSHGAEFQVTKNEISIGSEVTCDFRIRRAGIEEIHCTLLVHPNSSALLRNFSKKNPVEVNGEPILKNALLQDGDTIAILSKTLIWQSSSFKADKSSRKSVGACVSRSPGSVRNIKRRKSEPIDKLIAVVSPLRRSIDAQSPGFGTTKLLESLSIHATESSPQEEVTQSLSQNVTVRRKSNARVSPGSVMRLSRGGNSRKSILRTRATPRTSKSVKFDYSALKPSREHAIQNVPGTPANKAFNASECSSSDSGSASTVDLTNISCPDDVSSVSANLSESVENELSESETLPQSSAGTVRFDESSARALLSPFNTRKSSDRHPATPYVKSASKPLISFETPAQSLEGSSLMTFETPSNASVHTSDASLMSSKVPNEATPASEMKTVATRKKTPFKPSSSTRLEPISPKPGASASPNELETSPQTKLRTSPRLAVKANKILSSSKPIVKDRTPRRSTELIRLKKKPVPATPVLNLGEMFKTPGKQEASKTPVSSKLGPKKPTPVRLLATPGLNLKGKTPGKEKSAKTPVGSEPESKRQTATRRVLTPKVLNSEYSTLITPKGFSPAHHQSHLKCGMSQIGSNLRSGLPLGKTRGTYFSIDYGKNGAKSSKSKTTSAFIPKSKFTNKFTTPAKINIGSKSTCLTSANKGIAGDGKLNSPVEVSTPAASSISDAHTVNGEMLSVKASETTRGSAMTSDKTPALQKLKTPTLSESVASSASNCSSIGRTPIDLTFTAIDITSLKGDVSPDTSAAETDSKYSPGQTVADLSLTNNLTVPPLDLSVLQNSDILLNTPTNSRVTRKSVRTSEESQLLNSSDRTPLLNLQKPGTSAVNGPASSPFVNRSNVFKTPVKTPTKNTRSSTSKKATRASKIVKTPVELDASKRSKTLVAQSTPNANVQGLSVSLAFGDVSETPLKIPAETNTTNDALTISGSDLNETLKTTIKSNAPSLCSTIDDATVTISASGFEEKFDVQKSKSGISAKNLNETADEIVRPISQDLNITSPAEKSTAHLGSRKSKNNLTFEIPPKSPANVSPRTTSNSPVSMPKKYSSVTEKEGDITFVTHLTDLSGSVHDNSCCDKIESLPTPAGTSKSNNHSSCHASIPLILINGEVVQTPSKPVVLRKSKTPGSIRPNEIEHDYDESDLSVTKSVSKSPAKILQSSPINEMSVTSKSNVEVSPEKLERTDFEISGRNLNQTYSPNEKFIGHSEVSGTSARRTCSPSNLSSATLLNEKCSPSSKKTNCETGDEILNDAYSPDSNSEVSRVSSRKTRSSSNFSGAIFSDETCSSDDSMSTSDAARRSDASQQTTHDSSQELDYSDIDESETETSADVGNNETYTQSEDRVSTLRTMLNTLSGTSVANSDAVIGDPSEVSALNLDDGLRTPLKQYPPQRKKQDYSISPMLDLGDTLKTPSKTPTKLAQDSPGESNGVFDTSIKTPVNVNSVTIPVKTPLKTPTKLAQDSAGESNGVFDTSTKTPVNVNSVAIQVDGEDFISTTSSVTKFQKIPTRMTLNAVSPGIAAKVGSLYINTNLHETELNYEESFLPASADNELQIPPETSAKETSSSPVINTPLNTPAKSLPAMKSKASASLETESEVAKASPTEKISNVSELISSALNTANDVENCSFASTPKSVTLFTSSNWSVGSPLAEMSNCQMLNRSNNSKTPVEHNRSLTKENFNPEPSPQPKDSAKSPKKALCENTSKTSTLEPVSENKNSSSRLSNVSSITTCEPMSSNSSAKSARKSYSAPLAETTNSSLETSFSNVAAYEIIALAADGRRLKSKVRRVNAVNPMVIDQFFKKSGNKLQSLPSDDPQSSKVASFVDNIVEWNSQAEPCNESILNFDTTLYDFNGVKTPDIPKDVFVSPLPVESPNLNLDEVFKTPLNPVPQKSRTPAERKQSDSKSPMLDDTSVDTTDEELKVPRRGFPKKRLAEVSKSSERRSNRNSLRQSSESSSRRSSGSSSRRSSGSSSFIIPKKRTSKGKLPIRKLRFHPDVLSTPKIEGSSNGMSSDEEQTVHVRRSTRKVAPRRQSNITKEEEATKKPVKKSAKASQPKQKPASRQSKKAGTAKSTTLEKPVTKQAKSSVESDDISEPQRKTRRTIRTKVQVEAEVVENTSSVGNKTGAKRKITRETEEADAAQLSQRPRRTRTLPEKSDVEEELSVKEEEAPPENKKKRQTKKKNDDVQMNEIVEATPKKTRLKKTEIQKNEQVEENAQPTQRKTKSKITEIESEQVEQIAGTSQRKRKSTLQNRKALTAEEDEDEVKRRPKEVAETPSKSASSQTDSGKRKRRRAVKNTDGSENETDETGEEAVSKQNKARTKGAVKKTAIKAARKVSPVRTRSRVRQESLSQQVEEDVLPIRKRTAKVVSTKQVVGSSEENEEDVSPQKKTRLNKTREPSLSKRVTRSQK